MTNVQRRNLIKAIGATALAGPQVVRSAFAQGSKADIVVGAGQPLTGIFSFAGVNMNAGLNDYCAWRNANGGVLGHKLRYVAGDTGFKVDQGVTVFKKIMASDKPSFFYCDGTPLTKAIAQDVIASGSVMTASTSCAQVLADPVNFGHHFLTGPTYASQHEILMEYIAKNVKGASGKPTVALVYTEAEFGRDGIPGSKARAEKLGIPIVADIMTKQSGAEVAPEVARLRRAKPDVVIFQGYVVAPIPEFVKQMREAGMVNQVMGTIWGMDRPTYDAMAKLGESWMGVMPFRYANDPDPSKMVLIMRDYIAKNRPEMKDVSVFYIHAWLSGMIFAEVAERCIKAGKALTIANMKAALESMKDWDSGGITGLPVDLSSHQIKTGRLYRYNLASKVMEPASGWIKV